MLNISDIKINRKVDTSKYSTFTKLASKDVNHMLIKIFGGLLIIFFIMLFMPWTQNIRSKGYVTTMNPGDRPQMIQALIGGNIVKWHVREGQFVSEGDTIIQISEVKEEYLDPQILARTNGQINAKSDAANAYQEKAVNIEDQLQAMTRSRDVKLEQNEIKIQQVILYLKSDSIDLVAAITKQKIAEAQLLRMEQLYKDGLKPFTDLESKRLSIQEANATVIGYQNKLDAHRNELTNMRVNRAAIINEYQDKISKAKSEIMSAMSSKFDAQATVDKLQSQYNAYEVRQQNYYIKSPISGYVTKAIQSGIGEIVKNGDKIVSIVPERYNLAVEMYVEPMDMPLLSVGEHVRIQFDGWPAIVFSGWPNNSYGTFAGEIFAIDNFISENGMYRILIKHREGRKEWPKEVRIGGGANAIVLLNDVSIGYELWRQMNGFPPDFYTTQEKKNFKNKTPISKIK